VSIPSMMKCFISYQMASYFCFCLRSDGKLTPKALVHQSLSQARGLSRDSEIRSIAKRHWNFSFKITL
jgi:hypothetical protein